MVTSKRFFQKEKTMKVKPENSVKETLEVKLSPTMLLNLWLSGFDFSLISSAITQLSQAKSGTLIIIDDVHFTREGRSILVSNELIDRVPIKKKAALLLSKLVAMLSSKSAKEISTMK
jgi:hypothetical protein